MHLAKTWRLPWWDWLLWTTYALLAYAVLLAWTTPQHASSTDDALQGIAAGAILLVLVPWTWTRHTQPGNAWRSLGWAWFPEWAAAGAAAGILFFGLTMPLLGHVALPTPVALLYGAAAAVMEEIFFRGHLQTRIGSWQILAFAALHGDAGLASIMVPLAAGCLFTWLARHGLGASIACHLSFNLAAVTAA